MDRYHPSGPIVSKHAFDPNCPDCRPVLLDQLTGKALPPTDPFVQAVNRVWDASPRPDQEALHRLWVHNSRDPKDLACAEAFSERVKQATQS